MNSPTTLISNPDVVLLGLRAESGKEAIEVLHGRLSAQPGLIRDAPRFLVDLLARARLASVSIDGEIALPHARTTAVDRLVLAVGRTVHGVPFDPGHSAIRLIFLVGTPREALAEYLQMVAALSRFLRDPTARQALLDAPDEASFRAHLHEALA